jgi:predicted nucleotidyltransferase component of viral defense system
MLYTKTVDNITLAVLKGLMAEKSLDNFVLVGGTALALQIGHRKSVDLDFFTLHTFDPDQLLADLSNHFTPVLLQKSTLSLICTIEGIKVDFIHFRYPFIRPIQQENGFRLLSLEDIAPTKLDAVSGRGSRKDFYDVYFLLQHFTLEEMFGLYLEKYPHQTTFHVLRSLAYFEDAEKDPDPLVFDTRITWPVVKNKITEVIRNFG